MGHLCVFNSLKKLNDFDGNIDIIHEENPLVVFLKT